MKECRLWKPGSTPQKGLADQVLKHHQQQQKVSWMQISVLLNANNLPELADYGGAVPYISRIFRDISPPIWERPARQYKASPKLQAAASLDPLVSGPPGVVVLAVWSSRPCLVPLCRMRPLTA
jgi:hypothetical protein